MKKNHTFLKKINSKVMHKLHRRRIISLVLIIALISWSFPLQPTQAAPLTSIADTLDTITAAANANHDLSFTTPAGVAAGDTIVITFPAGFVLTDVGFADVDVKDDGVDVTLAATCSGANYGLDVTGQVMTLTSCTGTMVGGSIIRFLIGTNAAGGTDKIDNPSAGDYRITIVGPGVDSGAFGISIIADDSVNVTATVNESITFTITDTTIGFGTLTSANARWATGDLAGSASDTTFAHNMTIATNATTGYGITYNGATLTNLASDTITVASITNNADGTPGNEEFGLGLDRSGDAVIAAAYDHNATPASRDWAFVDGVTTSIVTEGGPTDTETIGAFYLGNIAGTTEAGAYSTNITYIATGIF